MRDASSAEWEVPRHPIRVVARRTGLKPDLIRAWERRYGAVDPGRTDGKHRLYSDADLERLCLLREATLGGRSIRHVANLADEALRQLIHEDQRAEQALPRRDGSRGADRAEVPTGDDGESHLQACLEAARQLDAHCLRNLLERAEVELSRRHLMQRVLAPLMVRIGELWHEGEMRPLHEHLATSVVRSFLGTLHRLSPADPTAPAMVITTPQGQRHEIGALLAASAAADEGWRAIYLGPDLPAAEIIAACHQSGARALALSIVFPTDDPHLGEELRKIHRHLDEDVTVMVGGSGAVAYASHLRAIGALQIEDLDELRATLASIRSPEP